MVKRYSVSVSDELAQKIEAHKGRFSLSKIFQDVMEDKIEREERFKRNLQEDESMEQAVERLRAEKAQSQKNWFEVGRDEGQEFAKRAHYEQLLYVVNSISFEGEGKIHLNALEKEEVFGPDYFESKLKESATEAEIPFWDDEGNVNEIGETWLKGWLQGVHDFWEQVKDKL